MKKKIFTLFSMTAVFFCYAENFTADFSSQEIPGMKLARKAKIENGVLKLSSWDQAAFSLDVPNQVDISFRIKVAEKLTSKRNTAWTVNIYGPETEYGMFRFRDDNVLESYFYKNKQKKGGIVKKYTNPPVGEWFQVSISVMKNTVSIKINGKEIGNGRHPGFLPLKKITFLSDHVNCELDDLTLSEIKPEPQKVIEKPTLALDFNNDKANGIDGNGFSSEQGNFSCDLKEPFNSKIGGIMFWFKVDTPQTIRLMELSDGKDAKITVTMGGDKRLYINVKRTDTKSMLNYVRSVPGEFGDWYLASLTWDADSNVKFFVNTLPYVISFTPGQRMPDLINADIDSIKQLKIIKPKKGSFTIDRLRMFHKTLKNSDVYDEFRKFMPFDMVMYRTVVPADTLSSVAVSIAPGGFYTRPMPVEQSNFITGKASLEFFVKDHTGKVLHTEKRSLTVNKDTDIELKKLILPTGRYTLECVINGRYRRSFAFSSFTSDYKPVPSESGIKLGRMIYSRKINDPSASDILKQGTVKLSADGSYLEAGNNKNDRFSFEISFADEQLGKPVALDIVWPDNKVRTMGWYMYPFGFGVNRDRLQTGVSAGNEFPNSGGMQTTRHIFYPGSSKYLFEARTLASGMPAAVAEIRIYEIEGGLPALKIRKPENMIGRSFGFYDEDQTFTNNLNADVLQRKSPVFRKFDQKYPAPCLFFTDQLFEYFDYTGMNTLHAPFWRYDVSYFPMEGQTQAGMLPGREIDYLLNAFGKNEKRFIAIMNYANVPDIKHIDKIESDYRKEGLETLDRFGDSISVYLMGDHRANICHPKVLKLFASYFEEPIRRYGKSGLAGIEYWINNFGTWGSLEWGYDDYTVQKFSRETGIKVPENIKERYPYLTTQKRKEWLKWRSEQVTNLVKMVRDVLNRSNPELKLYLGINQDSENYTKYGLDLEAIKKIPGVAFSVVRHPTEYRHNFHWGKAESTINEELYDFNNKDIENYKIDGKSDVVISYNHYFETFVHPLHKKYNCYFENADIKPHGRWYLREAAFIMGAFDTLEYVAGGQPLATIGREEETREFAKAYSALPAQKFNRVSGITDPTVARSLVTKNGTYFYVVNMFHEDMTVSLDFSKNISYMDLSTGKMLKDNKIVLKPFQLRSFLFPETDVTISNQRFVSTGKKSIAFYQKKIEELNDAAKLLKSKKIDVAMEEKDIANLRKFLKENRFAELYRIAFSRRMNQLLKKTVNLSNLIRKQEQDDKGHYAVNCGATGFYIAPDGVLFSPDQKFDGKYGYVGRYQSVGRETTTLNGTKYPELFKTEAYHLERYKFKVPNGKYKVILHLKSGFKPNYLPNTYTFSVLANGKPAFDKLDLYKMSGGDFSKTLRLESEPVTVNNGELVLRWVHNAQKKNQNATVCLANGIELKRCDK